MAFEVLLQGYESLSEKEKLGASDNGSGKEYANYVRVIHNGETIYLESDACEPEDKSFGRDLGWVLDAIRQAYALGVADASAGRSPV